MRIKLVCLLAKFCQGFEIRVGGGGNKFQTQPLLFRFCKALRAGPKFEGGGRGNAPFIWPCGRTKIENSRFAVFGLCGRERNQNQRFAIEMFTNALHVHLSCVDIDALLVK